MGFFTVSNSTTINDIKAQYRTLAKKYHPDLGGDTATMQRLNNEYELLLKQFDGKRYKGTDGKNHTYTYNAENEREIMELIYKFLELKLQNVTISLIGTWLWITGDTKPNKDAIKGLGFKWHGKRKAWYWRKFASSRYAKNLSLNDLAGNYGVKHFHHNEDAITV